MLRILLIVCTLLMATFAVAEGHQCSTNLKDDIIITKQHIQVKGTSGNLQITPDGEVRFNNKVMPLTALQRVQAINYQTEVRKELPWIKQHTEQKLAEAKQILDKLVVRLMGQDSQVRNRLNVLKQNLDKQIDKVIEQRADSLIFHHQRLKTIEADSRILLNESLGGILQDSINEMGRRQLLTGSDTNQSLQNLLGGLSGLQQDLELEWKKQEDNFRQFGQQVCRKITHMEQLRIDLLNKLK
ncbi:MULTISPECIES: DUF2884 family protein [Arsenophonus]|jgi:hypothetical protein|uniref:DUF2884 family protein n=1 Tax=Arsenophonus TaxID=637 RepID=UPI0015D79A70|nr:MULTISPECIES: DUF2884 family protein [Arsenophonus]UBX29603.1 DUF2884 family protein [Arsenophonus apicola]